MRALIAAFLALTCTTCSDGTATTLTADTIPGPPGYTCFAVMEDGRAVGGNCIKQ